MRTRVIEAPRYETKDENDRINGYVVSLYKDWENVFLVEPKQVYLNVCLPGQRKGPHLHMRRWGYFATIRGSLRYVIKYGAGDYEEVEVHEKHGSGIKVIEVPPGIPCMIVNIGNGEAWFINMPHPAWHPDDQDNNPVSYDDYLEPE